MQLVMLVFKASFIHLSHFYPIIFAKSEHLIEDSSIKYLCGTWTWFWQAGTQLCALSILVTSHSAAYSACFNAKKRTWVLNKRRGSMKPKFVFHCKMWIRHNLRITMNWNTGKHYYLLTDFHKQIIILWPCSLTAINGRKLILVSFICFSPFRLFMKWTMCL